MSQLFTGLDVSTQSCKLVVIDWDVKEIVYVDSVNYDTDLPQYNTRNGVIQGQAEGVSESDNTWRVGDGYTSFINLIYYTVAGFSEYDTFISNQIRSGMISRESGLAKAAHDNQPRISSLEEFARVIGFNFEEVLLKINALPKLY